MSQNTVIAGAKSHAFSRHLSWLETTNAGAFLSLGIVALILFGLFKFAVPQLGNAVTAVITPEMERSVGNAALEHLDRERFYKSGRIPKWSPDHPRRQEIEVHFQALVRNLESEYHYELQFRPIGVANAFALPGGIIILTEELMELVSDDEVIAILAHEIGHIEKQHGFRQLARTLSVLVLFNAVFGSNNDLASSIFGEYLINTSYQRNAETEADAFAVRLLAENSLDPFLMMYALRAISPVSGDSKSNTLKKYISTHPSTPKRVEMIKIRAEKLTQP